MVTLLQFEGQNVTPEDDAILYNALASDQCGIIKNCDISINASNNIAVQDGYILVAGRIVKLTNVVLIAEKPGGEAVETGCIYVQIDLTDVENPAKLITGVNKSTFRTSDINYNGTIYEYKIGEYTANSMAVLTVKKTALRAGRTPWFDRVTVEGGFGVYHNGKFRIRISENGDIGQYDANGTLRFRVLESGEIEQFDGNGIKRATHKLYGENLYDENGIQRGYRGADGLTEIYDENGTRTVRIAKDEVALYNSKGNVKAVVDTSGRHKSYDDNGTIRARMEVGEYQLFNNAGTLKANLGQDALVFYNDDGTVNRRL